MTTPGHEQFDPSVPQPWGTEPHPAQLAAQSGQAATQQTTTQQAQNQQAQNNVQAPQGQQYAITPDQAGAQNAAPTGATTSASAKRWGTQTLIAATIGAAMVGAGGVAAANAFGADTTGTSQQQGPGGMQDGRGGMQGGPGGMGMPGQNGNSNTGTSNSGTSNSGTSNSGTSNGNSGTSNSGTTQQGGQGGVMPGNGQPPQGNTSGS